MIILKNIKNAFRSLYQHRLRSILSTLGVLFGVVAVISMLSIGEGAKQEILEQIEQLGINNIIIRKIDLSEGKSQQAQERQSKGLAMGDAALLMQLKDVIGKVSPLKVVEAGITDIHQDVSPEILAVSPSFVDLRNLGMQEGRFICDEDLERRNLVCVLGAETARSLGVRGHAGQTIRIENVQYQIVGVLRSRHWTQSKTSALSTRNLNKSLFIPLSSGKTFSKKLPVKRQEELSEIHLQIVPKTSLHLASMAVKRIMEYNHHGVEDYQIIVPQELLNQAFRAQRTFNLVLGSIAAISLIVGGIGIMNIMLATVSERTREIGIRRAVGASRRHIIFQFLCETFVLTLSGAFSGVVIGLIFSYLISVFAGWTTIVRGWSILLSLGMASGVGIFSGLYPAFKAAQMDPIKALRND